MLTGDKMNKDKVIFNGYEIQNFILNKENNIPKEKKGNLTIRKKIMENPKKENEYCLIMNLEMYTEDSKIDITINGYFDISKNIEEDIKDYFLQISAPAIVYPYIRTFISNVTAFDIGETVVLPIINFAEFDEKENEK